MGEQVSDGADVYTHGHHESVLRSHRWRDAENSAGYLIPELRPAARVLDVGCGPGTISIDLARRVPRGTVLGLDREASVIATALEAAAASGVPNVDFAVGDVYSLEAGDGSFDVVHAHQLLQHLTDPVAALREMRRVCCPGGVVAARDSDYEAFTWFPASPGLDRWLDLYRSIARGNGAEPDAGRRLRSWALRAGFSRVRCSASAWCFADDDDRAWWGGMWADRVERSAFAEQAVEGGWSNAEELGAISAAWRDWAAAADGWFAVVHSEILCTP